MPRQKRIVQTHKDVYSQEVQYLRERPDQIFTHWASAFPLFGFAAVDRDDDFYGCLIEIRSDKGYRAETPALTAAIQADTRIPESSCGIRIEHLPLFARWQRRIDRELKRAEPRREKW